MPVILKNPNPLNPVYNPIVFELLSTDLGTPPIRKSLLWKLEVTDNFGTTFDVTDFREVKPFSASQVISVDVSTDIQPFLNTAIPYGAAVAPIILEDQLIHCKFRLKLYEKIVDTTNCSQEIILLTTSTDFIAINSCVQDYENDLSLLYANVGQVLDNRPSRYWIDRSVKDRIWVWGSGTITLTPNIGPSITQSFTNGCHMLPMYAYGAFSQQMEYMDVVINLSGNIYNYRVHFRDCVKNANISFLNHMGGRSVISFDHIVDTQVTSEFKMVKKYTPNVINSTSNNNLSKTNYGGRSMINKKSERWISLEKSVRNTDENYKFIISFLSSTGYLYFNDFGSQTKLILDGQPEPFIFDDEISIKIRGYYSNLFINQNNDQ